ncbi:MAG: NUDIX hydrolase [archaeon]
MAEDKTMVTVDVLVSDEKNEKFLLVKRKNEPFAGKWALPGGFVEANETVEQAAVREVKEELDIDVELEGLLGVYSEPGRDPRGHTVSIVFFGKKKSGKEKAGSDAEDFMWALLGKTDSIDFAFDHAVMAEDFKIIYMSEPEK